MNKVRTWQLASPKNRMNSVADAIRGPVLESGQRIEVVDVKDFEKLKVENAKLIEALNLADTLLNTPEHAQDDEWYEQRKSVSQILHELDNPDQCPVITSREKK